MTAKLRCPSPCTDRVCLCFLRSWSGSFKAAIGGSKSSPLQSQRRMSMSVIARVIVLGVPLMLAVAAVPAHAQVSVPVKVVNAKDAIQVPFTATFADGDSFAQTGTFTVPVGKRLVIEHLSGLARMQEQQRPAEVALT